MGLRGVVKAVLGAVPLLTACTREVRTMSRHSIFSRRCHLGLIGWLGGFAYVNSHLPVDFASHGFSQYPT